MSDVQETTPAAPRDPHAGAAAVLRTLQSAHPEDAAAAVNEWLEIWRGEHQTIAQERDRWRAVSDRLMDERNQWQKKTQELLDERSAWLEELKSKSDFLEQLIANAKEAVTTMSGQLWEAASTIVTAFEQPTQEN